ncbi:serine/threonine-protein kinase [Crossiella sp. CA-258035]|uniref:serine/threonine-protein kinase n=1 Tax=Crossiella sp. CA-258035 TaxID=2981138 RepID=UPI0024BCFB90|nr:serine/threonine-protein kinase [Crossiella sp. CA-258035]WHT17390.1 serine/threonine-protein kinase [Crossiella sp. CA-258035]
MAQEEARTGRLVGGRYRLAERLAAGGFGRVWRAYDETLRVPVAVKEVWLPPALSQEQHAERLTRAEREARNAAALREHPNIVPVHDIVIEDDKPWLVMRLVAGRSLGERIKERRRLPVAEVREVATALLAALEAVHAARITHRDVKPANVMLAEGGEVLLTDFGIAVHEADPQVTESGMIIGTLEYLSPERAAGQAGAAPSDLFSLGVTLYRAVEGVSPFRREPPRSTLDAIRFEEPPPMRHAGELAPLITRLLTKDPVQRPSATEARQLLDPASTTLTDDIPPPPVVEPPARSGRVVAAVLGTIAVLVLAYSQHQPFANFVNGGLGLSTSTTTARTTEATTGRTTTGRTTPATTAQRVTAAPTSTAAPASTAVDPKSLDRQDTDRTPLTTDALLPKSFRDSKNVEYTLRSGGQQSCLGNSERAPVRDALRRARCTTMLAATYVDHSDQVLVSVVVLPLPDATTATTAFGELGGTKTADWGIWCPRQGAGSTVCQGDYHRATQYGYLMRRHRYVTHARALYVNLSRGTVELPWVTAAAYRAAEVAGPR